MKTIALLPYKNEIKHLPSYINSISNVADLLICVDDNSTDDSTVYLKNQTKIQCNIHEPKKERGEEEWSVDKIRQQLLELGREQKGTHFICLDADECFTNPFIKKSRKILEKMNPGQKIQMQWLAMWKSLNHYREDQSVWSNNFKDFIFCDDKKSNFINEAYFCDPRTPGVNNEETLLKLNPKHGAIMHFQFSNWHVFQLKQCWYRCRELLYGKSAQSINQKFKITLDDPNVFVKACPEEWIPEVLPKIDFNSNIENNWHYQEIKKMFELNGVNMFLDLDIWHIKEIDLLR